MHSIIKFTLKNYKTILMSLWLIVLSISSIPWFSIAQEDETCNKFWWKCHVEDINTIHTKDDDVNAWLLDTIKNAINWILWILATVALVICMYWWFTMLTSGTDTKWYDNWLKVLKNAAIWLGIILLAWMIVSVIFRFVGTLSWWNQTNWNGVT